MVQLPWGLVRAAYLTLVSSEIRVTAALGTTPPCGSVTRPPSVARTSWERAGMETRKKMRSFIANEVKPIVTILSQYTPNRLRQVDADQATGHSSRTHC